MEEPLQIHGIGNSASQYSKILSMIKRVGLAEEDLLKYPHQFSGGQRQRIGIARALYKRATILVFDEATSALDNETEQSVMNAIEGLGSDLTILMIAHRLTTLRQCNIIVDLEQGRVVAQGTYEQILERSSSFSRMAKVI